MNGGSEECYLGSAALIFFRIPLHHDTWWQEGQRSRRLVNHCELSSRFHSGTWNELPQRPHVQTVHPDSANRTGFNFLASDRSD